MILTYKFWQEYPDWKLVARVTGTVTQVTAVDKGGERTVSFNKSGELVSFNFTPRYEKTIFRLTGQEKELSVVIDSFTDDKINSYGDVELIESQENFTYLLPACDVTALKLSFYDQEGRELEVAYSSNPTYELVSNSTQLASYLGYNVMCFELRVDWGLYRESDDGYDYESLMYLDHRIVFSNLKPLAGSGSLSETLYPTELYNKSYYFDRSY